MFNLPFPSSDKFGLDVNGLADGMGADDKLALVDRHYAACERRDKRRMLLALVTLLAMLVAHNIEWVRIPWL